MQGRVTWLVIVGTMSIYCDLKRATCMWMVSEQLVSPQMSSLMKATYVGAVSLRHFPRIEIVSTNYLYCLSLQLNKGQDRP